MFDNFQRLRQDGEADCSVPVFGELTGLTREEILRELPQAAEAKVTVVQWEDWLRGKGLQVHQCQPNENYTLPCAHLVVWAGDYHWIYQDETGVYDPNGAFRCMPPDDSRMLNLSFYKRALTICVKPGRVVSKP